MILPALTEAKSPFWRPIKYSLFPPLGLATLAAYIPPDWSIELQDEHVEVLEAYEEFYKWNSIFRGALAKPGVKERLRHVAYAGGWKKFEPLWDWVIRAKRVASLLPMLETVLTGFGSHPSHSASSHSAAAEGDAEAGHP